MSSQERLRWKLSKIYKKTLDDPWFDNLTPIQWCTYAVHIAKDEEEDMIKWRDRIEYLARFWNNEAVEKIQQAREKAKYIEEDVFKQQIEELFGEPVKFKDEEDN